MARLRMDKPEFPPIKRGDKEVGSIHSIKIYLPSIKAGDPGSPLAKLELGLQQDVAEAGYLVVEGPALHPENRVERNRFAHRFLALRKELMQTDWPWDQARILRDMFELAEECPEPAA